MNSLRTKKKLKTGMSWWLPLVFLCLSVLFFSYTVTQFWFAQTEPEWEPNYLVDWDYIVVTWVANTVEYLTSLYLYVTDPKSSTSVNMRYDPELNALLINSSINANAMGIWYNTFWEWVVWSVMVWWSWNVLSMRGQEVLDDYWDYTWTRNGKNDSAVAIWWVKNSASSAWGVIIWWRNSTVHYTDSTMIWGVDSSLAWHRSVALWSRKSSLNAQDWNSIDMWYNNHWDKYTFLIWSWINTHWGWHYSTAVRDAFAYSPGNSGFALHGWNLWWQPWFYVNVKNGFWLNTSTPRLTFDFRSAGPLRVIRALWVQNNTMQFTEWGADGITCPDEVIVEKYRWTVAYVQTGWIWAFCWCNGKVWMPMSSDANEQALCAESKVDARVCEGEGSFDKKSVIFHEETKGKPRWDEDANGWRWEWINLSWTYMWVPSLNSVEERECSYTCAVWYHPNHKSAKWWFTGNCIACSELLHWTYISPGTGVNDCEFACHWWYKYNKWAETEAGRCTSCANWEWTETGNQAMLCNQCEVPVWISAKSLLLTWWLVFTWWVMWNWTTWTWEPYFRAFTSPSTIGEYGCDFQCASWYMYSYNGTEAGNKCIECEVWTFSPWWTYPWDNWSCAACTNREQSNISFSYKSADGKSSYSYTIAAKDASWYTTKWTNWSESCEWICNPKIWFVKAWKSCKCPDDSHLELIGGQPRCISNTADLVCTGTLWSYAIKWASLAKWVSAWTLEWNNWEARKMSWTYVNTTPDKLGACEWTCPKDYTRDGNDCKPPVVGECWRSNWKLVDSLSTSNMTDLCYSTNWVSGFTLLSNEIEINYFVDGVFQFHHGYYAYPAKYLAIWTCNWYNNDPKYSASCFAYVKWEAINGQCWPEYIGDEVQPKCKYTPNNCIEGKNCPPYMEDKRPKTIAVELRDNITPHWWTRKCPGTFWWNVAMCNFCDKDYSWWTTKKGCTKTKIITNCFWTRPSIDNANINDGPYDNIFDDSLSGWLGWYVPWKLFYTRLEDGSPTNNPCEYACSEGYYRCNGYNNCYEKPECMDYVYEDEENTGHYIGVCKGSATAWNVTTWEDGKFHYDCSIACHSRECFDDYYSCEDPIAHTVSVWQTEYLTERASYELYSSYEAAVASWKPCAVYCDPSYKYVDGDCVQFNCPSDPIPDNAVPVDNGKYSQLNEEPTAGNVLYATEAEAEANPCGYVCKENYEYVGGTCVCTDCEAAPLCWEPKNRPWNRRSSPQFCDEAYGEGNAEYATCLAKAYNYCDEWNRTDFEEHFTGTLNDRLDYVSWKCERWGASVPCRSVGCRGWTDNVNPNILCVNSSNSDSIYIDRTNYRIKANWLTGSWQNNYLKLVMGTKEGWVKGQWYVNYYTRAKPNGIVRWDTITFTSNDPRYCAEWKLTLVQCRDDLFCDDNNHGWQCCKETEKNAEWESIWCKNTSWNIKASGTVDYDGNLIDDNGNHIVY